MKINGAKFESARYVIGAQQNNWASLVTQTIKILPAVRETRIQFLGEEDPWRRKWQLTPVFLPREF